MGLEATCVARVGRRRATAKALLESDHVILRLPDERLKIFFRDITKVDVKDGRLTLDHAGGNVTLYLGAGASKWAEKIRNPRSLMDKLGVKQGMRVSVVDVDDAAFLLELDSHTATSRPRGAGPIDVLFFGTEDVGRSLGSPPSSARSRATAPSGWCTAKEKTRPSRTPTSLLRPSTPASSTTKWCPSPRRTPPNGLSFPSRIEPHTRPGPRSAQPGCATAVLDRSIIHRCVNCR